MTTVSSTGSTLSALFDKQTLEEIKKAQEAGQTEATGSADGVAAAKDADQAKVSQFGQMMSKLQQMASTDQDAFKAAAQTIADNLTQSASESTDPTQKAAFAAISASFAEAAKTGDMSSLKDVGQAMLGVSAPASGSVAGGDTVTISNEGKDLASKDGSTGGSDSGDSSGSGAEQDATGAETAGFTSSSLAAGQSKSGGGGGGASSSSDTTVSDLEDEIDDMKVKIKAMQAKVQQSEQEAKGDDSKADAVKAQQAQLNSLNVQLAQLQLEKLQAETETSSSSGSSSASGGASMTTHA